MKAQNGIWGIFSLAISFIDLVMSLTSLSVSEKDKNNNEESVEQKLAMQSRRPGK